ncbi:Hypothetical predicted protein [Lecanosticta acicola]|uniref:Uncharacterized protein n=1 Tax=Lecanosticta acicola TaxID=111012 RepID=A0AAI9ED67_9PEZI|nr:Hypothetical predicted protein [Lecanosticta acicola]
MSVVDGAQMRRELSPPGPKSPGAHSRSFSIQSDKSGGSQKTKEDQRRDDFWKNGSKSNPNAALSEAQPGVNAVYEESTLTSLRGLQHRDAHGNAITDPDLSNPTRPRMERPLDTIRSFEKAIDNGYKRRSSFVRAESYGGPQDSQYAGSRRNSGYGEFALPSNSRHRRPSLANRMAPGFDGQNRWSTAQPNGGGYYGGQRPDSFAPGPPRRFAPPPRNQSDPMMYGHQPRPYPHGHQASQDTMHTGVTNGSDSTGPWANSTDPSSENSSVERGPSAMKPYPDHPVNNGHGPPNGYGPGGYGQGSVDGPIPEDGAYTGGAVQPPQPTRRPIPLGNSGDPITELPSSKRPEPEKRKSWLARRFSKKG